MMTVVQRHYYDDVEIRRALVHQLEGREGSFLAQVKGESICKRSMVILSETALSAALANFTSSVKPSSPPSVLSSVESYRDIHKLDQLGVTLRTDWDFIIDIDSTNGTLEGPIECVKGTAHLLSNIGFSSLKLKFSGMKGFHIIIPSGCFKLKKTTIDKAKWIQSYPGLAKLLAGFIQAHLPKKALEGVKIDIANFYTPRRLVRLAYSMHDESRLVSIPLQMSDLADFRLDDARPDNLRKLDWDWLDFKGGAENADVLLNAAFEWKSYVERSIKKREQEHRVSVGKRTIRPCVVSALSNNALPNKMRLAVAVEYLEAGYPVDEVVPLFRNQLDFNTNITRYQVKHAKEKGYFRFMCKNIHDLGFCLHTQCGKYHRSLEA